MLFVLCSYVALLALLLLYLNARRAQTSLQRRRSLEPGAPSQRGSVPLDPGAQSAHSLTPNAAFVRRGSGRSRRRKHLPTCVYYVDEADEQTGAAAGCLSASSRALLAMPVRGFEYAEAVRNDADDKSYSDQLKQRRLLDWSLLRSRTYMFMLVVGATYALTTGVPDTHGIEYTELLFPENKEASGALLVASGLAEAGGKFLFSPLADAFPSVFGRAIVYGAGVVGKWLSTAVTPLTTSFAVSVALNGLYAYGFSDSASIALQTPTVASVVGGGARRRARAHNGGAGHRGDRWASARRTRVRPPSRL